MGDSNGRCTHPPSLSPMRISHKTTKDSDRLRAIMPVIRAFREPPTSGRLSHESPNDGQLREPLRSGWTPSLHVSWG